jgi:hypothetical protein
VSRGSPKERRWAPSILNQIAPDEALEPLLVALEDPDKRVRAMAMVVLLSRDPPAIYGDKIVARLGGEFRTAECFVQHRWRPGPIGSFALTERLLPHLEKIAQTATHRTDRHRAAHYARELRQHPIGWPLVE